MLTLQDTASSAGQKDTGYSATGTTLLFFFFSFIRIALYRALITVI